MGRPRPSVCQLWVGRESEKRVRASVVKGAIKGIHLARDQVLANEVEPEPGGARSTDGVESRSQAGARGNAADSAGCVGERPCPPVDDRLLGHAGTRRW